MTKIVFQNEENGYDRNQVDNYIDKLSEAYRVAYDENQIMQSKYAGMIEDYKKMEQQLQTKLNAKVIAKTMMDMEILAQKIIEEAHKEAEGMKGEALQILDDAYGKAAEIEARTKQMTDDALLEKAEAESVARKIIEEAQTDAADMVEKARLNIDEAKELMCKTVARAQGLLMEGLTCKEAGAA